MEQIDNNENYTADTPISDQKKDRFQRYSFSKRIAETISQRKTADSIVIGIYGDWGEGKTSVLNFIEENLAKDPDIIVCKFNPWRFKDETQLLVGFFNLLATQLKKTIKTKGEKIGKLISDFLLLSEIPCTLNFISGISDFPDVSSVLKLISSSFFVEYLVSVLWIKLLLASKLFSRSF